MRQRRQPHRPPRRHLQPVADFWRGALGRSAYHTYQKPRIANAGELVKGVRLEHSLEGDNLFRGLHAYRATTVTDTRIVFPDSGTRDAAALLRDQDKQKRTLYQDASDDKGVFFAPFSSTTCGALGAPAQAVLHALARKIEARWQKPLGYTSKFG